MRDRRGGDRGDVAASAIGVARGTYYRLERGEQTPSYDTAVKLASWLGWTTDQVMAAAVEPAP